MECSICLEDFSLRNEPYVLNCGHSICNDCKDSVEVCPICRTVIISRNKNFSLIESLKKIQENSYCFQLRKEIIQEEEDLEKKDIIIDFLRKEIVKCQPIKTEDQINIFFDLALECKFKISKTKSYIPIVKDYLDRIIVEKEKIKLNFCREVEKYMRLMVFTNHKISRMERLIKTQDQKLYENFLASGKYCMEVAYSRCIARENEFLDFLSLVPRR